MEKSKNKAGEMKRTSWINWLKRNGLTVFLGGILVLMMVNPNVKSWTLRQLMATGFFNAKLQTAPAEADSTLPRNFQFQDIQGKIYTAEDLRGKVVFINFWASWCPPCRAEFPSIQKLIDQFSDQPELMFLMINEDANWTDAESFLEKENYTFPVYTRLSALPEHLYSGVLPTTLIFDKNGGLRLKKEGFAHYNSKSFVRDLQAMIDEN
ncbi:MAG: TlpA family protein disulfide reductase [Sphingobacterium sp.]